MKGSSVAFWWFAVGATVTLGQVISAPAEGNSLVESVIERTRHSKVVERVQAAVDASGGTVLKTNRYVVVQNGLNRKNELGEWVECTPVVRSYADALVCTGAAFRAVLSENLNTVGAVDLETSAGERMVTSPLAILLFDPEMGQSLTVGTIQDCAAELLSTNAVTLRISAFNLM